MLLWFKKNYAFAAQKANEAREEITLMSNAEYTAGFNDYSNSEWMWGIHIIADQSDYNGNFMAFMYRNFNSPQILQAPKVMNVNLYDYLPDDDVRKFVVDPTGRHRNLNLGRTYRRFPYASQKFLAITPDVSLDDVPFMRGAEMYLIEAEALYHIDEAASKAVLQELVDSRTDGMYAITSTGLEYYEEILLQRRAELWGEGFRFLDLKRLGQALDRTNENLPNMPQILLSGGVITLEPSDSKWQWMIPMHEINTNPLIIQND